jgi:hypothetical protein
VSLNADSYIYNRLSDLVLQHKELADRVDALETYVTSLQDAVNNICQRLVQEVTR